MKDSTVRFLSRFHTHSYRLTGGRLGRRLVENDMLLLTTIGRRSGRRHVVPLLYLRDGDRLVVIASYGGRPRHPEWFLNLVTTPDVEIQIGGTRFAAVATVASAADRTVWWPRIIDTYASYAEYQTRTDRPIPVVFVTVLRQ